MFVNLQDKFYHYSKDNRLIYLGYFILDIVLQAVIELDSKAFISLVILYF